ncbi:MAG: hypothetical protein ABFS18_00310 [Thermodesulfobacteriota bacterium]
MKKFSIALCLVLFLAFLAGGVSADVVEDFEDGVANDWEIVMGDWQIVQDVQADGTWGNVLKQTAHDQPQGGIGNAMVRYDCGYEWTDYTVEADVKMNSGSDFWMAWRSGVTGQNYAQWFSGGTLRSAWSGGGAWGAFGYSKWYWQYNKWYHLKVEIDGPIQKFYVDDTLMFTQNQYKYAYQGTVNFRTLRSFMTIDNIVVTGVDGCVTILDANVDIDPDTLNLNAGGVFTAYVTLPEEYSVEEIDTTTVECEGAPAVKTSIEDNVLIAKFFREDLIGVEVGDAVTLTVTGQLDEETFFEGSSVIRVISKGGKK